MLSVEKRIEMLHDEICAQLTIFENNEDEEMTVSDWLDDFYSLLVHSKNEVECVLGEPEVWSFPTAREDLADVCNIVNKELNTFMYNEDEEMTDGDWLEVFYRLLVKVDNKLVLVRW